MIIAEHQEWQSRSYPFRKNSVIGVVHLKPLPGSPGFEGDLQRVKKAALMDAAALCEGGVNGLIVENFGDAPFHPDTVEPHTVGLMAVILSEITSRIDIPVGVNVLRNDAKAALGAVLAGRGAFIRVNVLTGASVTDQGIIQGKAHEILRYRQALGSKAAILADVHVKHGTPLGRESIEDAAKDAFERGGADALIVTGDATGAAVDLDALSRVKAALPDAPVLAGSGVTEQTVKKILEIADGVIVGTWFKKNGRIHAPVDPDRVSALIRTVRG